MTEIHYSDELVMSLQPEDIKAIEVKIFTFRTQLLTLISSYNTKFIKILDFQVIYGSKNAKRNTEYFFLQ